MQSLVGAAAFTVSHLTLEAASQEWPRVEPSSFRIYQNVFVFRLELVFVVHCARPLTPDNQVATFVCRTCLCICIGISVFICICLRFYLYICIFVYLYICMLCIIVYLLIQVNHTSLYYTYMIY